MSIKEKIQIFITGGTFDKSYDYIEGALYFEKTHLPEMLKRSRCRLNVSVETLMMLDSLEMNETHIEQIISKASSKFDSIIIPKIEAPEQVKEICRRLTELELSLGLVNQTKI